MFAYYMHNMSTRYPNSTTCDNALDKAVTVSGVGMTQCCTDQRSVSRDKRQKSILSVEIPSPQIFNEDNEQLSLHFMYIYISDSSGFFISLLLTSLCKPPWQ